MLKDLLFVVRRPVTCWLPRSLLFAKTSHKRRKVIETKCGVERPLPEREWFGVAAKKGQLCECREKYLVFGFQHSEPHLLPQ